MKQKTIERIPYTGLSACSRKKGKRFVVTVSLHDIKGENHLFIEIYNNRRDLRNVPIIRMVLSQKESAVFHAATKEWTSREGLFGIDDFTGSMLKRLWHTSWSLTHGDKQRLKADAILSSEEDLQRITDFCGPYSQGEWVDVVRNKCDRMRTKQAGEKRERANRRRQEALKERAANTPELPEERVLAYADGKLFHGEHHLYYKKHGCMVDVACTACGAYHCGRWKAGESYESQYLSMEEPMHGRGGTCKACGARGTYVAAGKEKDGKVKREYVFLGQRYKGDGFLLRYILTEKRWWPEWNAGKKGLELSGGSEKLECIEITRTYFERGKDAQTDFHKASPYTGTTFWDDCNLQGNANIAIYEADIMPDTYEAMKGTIVQYSGLEEFQQQVGKLRANEYLERYLQTPQIEMLTKLGMVDVVKKLMDCRYGIVAAINARRPDTFLGIRPERVRMLSRERGDLRLLGVLQQEERQGKHWSEETINKLRVLDARVDTREIQSYMSVQKFLNHVEKYAGCVFSSGCSAAIDVLGSTARTYMDYLQMRDALGYDMSNEIYLFPKSLQEAHNKMVVEKHQEELDKRVIEVEQRFPEIRSSYRKLRRSYLFEDERYQIRPARSAEEIVMEGRLLHHCVGGDTYLSRHARGESYILMLRKQGELETPYITVEIDTRIERIKQWYGAYDKKPDRENIDRWLKAYITRRMSGAMAAGADEEAEQRILMPAM